jgi:hypothetical protein
VDETGIDDNGEQLERNNAKETTRAEAQKHECKEGVDISENAKWNLIGRESVWTVFYIVGV